MSDRQRQFFMVMFFIGIFFNCGFDKSKEEERSETSPDTLQTSDFYLFTSAAAFLDSGYDVLAVFEETNDIPVLSVEDSYHIFREKAALFIDARDPEEFDAGHIPGAVNIPYDQITLPEYSRIISKLDENRCNVVYCNTHICSVSYTCAEYLMYLGFKRVIIAEGYMQWVEKGYPVEKFGP
jgi:rhodanese-related sulfurtransferase